MTKTFSKLGLISSRFGPIVAIDSASAMANIDNYKVVRYFKELDPFEIFISELLDNLDIEFNFGTKSKKILNLMNNQYRFINEEKDVDMISFCFDCEYFDTK